MGDRSDKRTAVVLMVDRLGAGFLGPMGNTWIETPVLNELASHSFVAEQAWVDSPDPTVLYHSLWKGCHALWAQHSDHQASLVERLKQKGGQSWLITDDVGLSQHPLHSGFDRVEVVTTDGVADETEGELAETEIARLFSFAAETIADHQPDLLWIHSRGMSSAWDAPLDLRDQFMDEDDPPPPRTSVPPSFVLEKDFHHDDLQGWIWSYAGQVVLLDMCLDVLLAALDQLQHPNLFILMGVRGYPLGEHGALGPSATGLYSELLHVPLFVQVPTVSHAVRSQRLVQPFHVYQTLCEWMGLEGDREQSLLRLIESPVAPWYDLAVTVQPDESSLLSTTWRMRTAKSGECQLYLKPDDFWDFNDISDRCQVVVNAFDEFTKRLPSLRDYDAWKALFPLPDVLETRMD